MISLTENPSDGNLITSQSVNRSWRTSFEPLPWLRGGHAQTLAGNYWRRLPFTLSSEAVAVEVDPADGSRILCRCHWQPESVRADRLTILLVHGLEGSSDSRYIQGITTLAWSAGCNVIRMNMRNCGGTETWSPTLYHSGLSGDVHAVLRYFVDLCGLKRVAMVGYSMGGNLVLKLAGDLAEGTPEWLKAAVGVSPAMDLAASADALHEPSNRMYEKHFLRNLMNRFHRKIQLFPEIYSMERAKSIRSIREFDDLITAYYSGFAGADEYYSRAASARVASHIVIPTLVLNAQDDPFIRLTHETALTLKANLAITFMESRHGGHCAFLAKSNGTHGVDSYAIPMNCRHWAEATLVRFLMATAGHANGG